MNLLNGFSIACVLALASTPFATPKQNGKLAHIVPKQMQAQFSQGAPKAVWTDNLYSLSNKKLYVLSLNPEVNVGKHVVGIDLVLRNAEESEARKNLLSPTGKWHGLQPYNFVASDLLHGAERSAFGARRSIKVTSGGLDIEIQVLDVKVGALPDGTQEIDELKLSIFADNLPRS